jgi:hypothetical protein
MSYQPEHENQQPETVTPQVLRQFILAELEAKQQVIGQLSDEQLVEIVGGTIGKVYTPPTINWTPKQHTQEIAPVLEPHHVSPAPSTASPAPSTASPVSSRTPSPLSATASSTTSSGSYSPTQSNSWRQTLHRLVVGCFTCGRLS